ncbi:MAG: hypothetical protein R3318_01210 [Gammaproteobacteria bacterium]|nr:hypothetical protein [Gammaproteobacteria bacterium]
MNSIPDERASLWASGLGIIIIIMGVYLTASHGNQLMKYWVLDGKPSVEMAEYKYKCPEDELIEEGITLEMCKQKTENIDTILLSIPDWFRGYQITLMLIGTVVAFISIFAGIALHENRAVAPLFATGIISALLAIDIAGFVAVVLTGPLTRQLYLWDILLWCFLHAVILSALVAGKHEGETVADNRPV